MSGDSIMDNRQDPPMMIRITSIGREKFSLTWSINQFGEFLDRKYEFSSPVFLPDSPGTSKWKLVVFPEIVYPEGMQVVLQLLKVSTDDKCYSVNYIISLVDSNGTEHTFQTREKVFRNYLDYDQCSLTTNRTIKEKSLLQSNGTLTICCKIDLIFCENEDDAISDSLMSCKDISVPVTNDLSMTNKKLTESENINNSLALNDLSVTKTNKKLIESENINSSLTPNDISSENTCQKSVKREKVENNDLSKTNEMYQDTIVIENAYFSKPISSHRKRSFYGNEKKTSGLSEKIDSFFQKTREKAKDNGLNPTTLKDLEKLSTDLDFLYSSKYQYDVTIHTKDGQIRAHKAILVARSDYFRKTLMQDEEEIQILGLDSATLNVILFYMYTGHSPQMTYNQAINILTASDQFNLDDLKDMAQNSLKSQINISNVTEIFRISKEMNLEGLKMCALKFVAFNHEAVTNSAKWNQLISNDPHGAGEILLTIASFQNKPKKGTNTECRGAPRWSNKNQEINDWGRH